MPPHMELKRTGAPIMDDVQYRVFNLQGLKQMILDTRYRKGMHLPAYLSGIEAVLAVIGVGDP